MFMRYDILLVMPFEIGECSRLKPGTVPSVFDFKTPQQESDRSKRMRLRCARESGDVTDTVHLYDVQEEVVVESLPLTSDSQPLEEEPEIEHVDKEVQCEIPVVGKFAIEGMKNNSRMISFYTGFNNYDHFMLLFNILGPAAV